MTSVSDIEDRAASWLMRREEPGWTLLDEQALEAWLGESDMNRASFWRLEQGWRAADRLRSLGGGTNAGDAAQPSRQRHRRAVAIAASLAMLTVILGSPNGPKPERVSSLDLSTPVGGRSVVPMPDGSRIELNTATRLRAAINRQHREVWLDRGEAYFEVAHSPDHPFLVHAGRRTITVLGTKFSVRRAGDDVIVAVVEGRVRIDGGPEPEQTLSSTVTSGDIAIARDTSMLVTAGRPEDVAGMLSWRGGMLDLGKATLADAAAEFNRYNRTKIIVDGTDVGQLRLGGRIRVDNVEGFVSLLKQAYGVRVQRTGNALRISD